jgi:hypothetical protein
LVIRGVGTGDATVTSHGRLLHDLMELSRIEAERRDELLATSWAVHRPDG